MISFKWKQKLWHNKKNPQISTILINHANKHNNLEDSNYYYSVKPTKAQNEICKNTTHDSALIIPKSMKCWTKQNKKMHERIEMRKK